MSEEFYRMKRLPPYVIAEVNAMRAAARAAGEDIIDLGMGNPDLPPPDHVIAKLVEVASKPDAHGYSQSKGIPGLRKAQANYYGRRFGVDVDPETEVVVTMGSTEGLASLATAITAPGDVVLAPNPSYPIHMFGFIIAGATIRSVPTTPDENYFRALDRAMAFTVPRPSILVVNYPSNPTAETVDLAFYERLVAWAKENKVWVLSDLAYSELYYDGNPTPSILQVPGAKDVAFTPIQAVACAALNGPQDIVAKNRELYHKRRDVMVESFSRAGWDIPAPRASMFAWAPLPPALKDMGSLEFSKQLLTHAKVAVAPGVGYGEDGEGYVRIAMVENEQRLRQAARNIKQYLKSMGVNTPSSKGAA